MPRACPSYVVQGEKSLTAIREDKLLRTPLQIITLPRTLARLTILAPRTNHQSEAQDYHDKFKLQRRKLQLERDPKEWLRFVLLLSTPTLHLNPHPPSQVNMSGPSLAPYILKRPWLLSWMKPFAEWYANAAGYRRLGTTSREQTPRILADIHSRFKIR